MYLEQWRQCRLTEERREASAERLEQLERNAEAEEECRARGGAAQPTAVQPPVDDVAAAWETAFPWAGPAATLVDLASSAPPSFYFN